MIDTFDEAMKNADKIVHVSKKPTFKKLADYSEKQIAKPAKQLQQPVEVKKVFPSKIPFKPALILVLVIVASFAVYGLYDGKFQSIYSNNVTVEASQITCPTPVINNAYNITPNINSTCTIEVPEINCNCGNSS